VVEGGFGLGTYQTGDSFSLSCVNASAITTSGGTDGTNTGSFGGTTALTYTEGSPFTPYADLTQEQVSGWVLGAWTADQTASYQSQLDSQLAVTSPPLPWPAAESVAPAPVAA